MAQRSTQYHINSIFIERWSARAMSGKAMPKQELLTLFEAARWAPSSYNNQPWRFVFAMRDTPEWKPFFETLVDFNKQWVCNASALVVIVSKDVFEYNNKPSRTASFDTGAAWMSLAIQGFMKGMVVHGMEGFDYEKAKQVIKLPENHTILAMCAVGYPGDISVLPPDIAQKEVLSDRKPLETLIFEGSF